MLQALSLACRRGRRLVFRDLSFTLEAGESLIVTGANGSGKSSLLRTLATLIPLHQGTLFWEGNNITKEPDDYVQSLQYIGHLDSVKFELTVEEMLNYWMVLSGLPSNMVWQDRFNILAMRHTQIRYLSAGQKRRLVLSRLLQRQSKLWLLDEPGTALDREGQAVLQECIDHHRDKGGIIIMASHHDMQLSSFKHYEMPTGKTV